MKLCAPDFKMQKMSQEMNLILIGAARVFDLQDFWELKVRIEARASDIEVFVVDSEDRSALSRKKAARRPSLVVSPLQLMNFRPERGKVYCGRPMSKLAEMAELAKAGMPVPVFEELTLETRATRDRYGEYVVTKSSHPYASFGSQIELHRTENVVYRAPESFPEGHIGRLAPFFVQKFIDSGMAMSCRVLTFFGRPIFSYCRHSTVPMNIRGKVDRFEPHDFLPMRPNMRVYVDRSPDILELASRAYKAMPDIPLQACDIIRALDGSLYIFEINPGGGTWMFSTVNAKTYKTALGLQDLSEPFDAFETCADILVERTRQEAV